MGYYHGQIIQQKADTLSIETTYHYQLIERAIAAIDASDQALSLSQLADQLGMNPQHFQKTFSQWAGVSPKRYQQYLTLNHAKSLMSDRHCLLEVTHNSGLSSTGRLHDLFIRWEAMTPGEYAQKGHGLSIGYASVDTPFGPALAMATHRGLCGLSFVSEGQEDVTFAEMTRRWPKATFAQDTATISPLVTTAIHGGNLNLHLIGAPFQIKVWEALLSIPEGQVTSYSDIAKVIKNEKAARAVGTAIGKNPIGWLIPCHRVLRKTGELGGYHWGLPKKRAMLAYESIREDTRD